LSMAQLMSKQARISFFNKQGHLPQAGELTRPARLCYHR
jgi:hypothetical protein